MIPMNNSFVRLAFVLSIALFFASCGDDSIYSGFEKMDNGAYMKFYSKGESEVAPRLNDGVTFEMTQYFDDTLLFSTSGDEPLDIVLKKADFVGDVSDALLMMHIGDSARLVVISDSIFNKVMNMETPAEYAGKPIYYDLKLLSVKPYEIIEAEQKVRADSLKTVEAMYLAKLKENPKYTLSNSGLIVMETNGKGKLAKLGEYLDFDFTICNPDGDTIMNTFNVEPVDIQYGEEFIGKGFTEALGMVPEGGSMRFVIPSELAFDSIGYQQFVEPYTPLVVYLKMNNVRDKEAFDKWQADLNAEKEAERERLLLLERKTIEDYINSNNITDTPTESGLYILREKEGTGDVAKWGDKVSIHYILSNLKDDVLESSYDYEQPFSFLLGKGEMIPAIEEALMTMSPGAKVTLISPSELAFGEIVIDEETIPAFTPLKIELELLSVE